MEEIEVRQIFADNLKRLRKQKGLSQLKLSNEMQMAFTFINDIENCKKWVSPETLARFATFFNVPVSTFFSTNEENAHSVIQASFVGRENSKPLRLPMPNFLSQLRILIIILNSHRDFFA